jgi:hypothetical protein
VKAVEDAMALSIRLRLTGEAEKFLRDAATNGIDYREVIATGLWLAATAKETGRLAILREGAQFRADVENFVDQIVLLGQRTPGPDSRPPVSATPSAEAPSPTP